MSPDPATSLLDSEDAFLRLIDRRFGTSLAGALFARGDDCTVWPCSGAFCLSTDLFLEDVHFRTRYFEPEDVGYKALAVNLSDVAAMGARPAGFTVSLIAPRPADPVFFDKLFSSMAELARSSGAELAGGDVSGGDKLGLCVTIWGEAAGDQFIPRHGALPGDVLFLVGDTGLARAGLAALEESGPLARKALPLSCAAHLRPTMHLEAAAELGEFSEIRALMDVSDGLARDLPRFLEERGAELAVDEAAIHPEVLSFCRRHSLDPVEHVLLGGEDYALLGAVAPGSWPELLQRVPSVRQIGQVTEQPGLRVNGRRFEVAGFDHFSQGGGRG
jgi:thiamine-monophosphate kinase